MTTLRTVTNSGSPLSNPDGTPAVGVTITFQIADTFGAPIDVWDATDNSNISNEAVSTTTDDTGTFSIGLWPNDRGNVPSRYLCQCQTQGIKVLGFVATGSGNLTFYQFVFGG